MVAKDDLFNFQRFRFGIIGGIALLLSKANGRGRHSSWSYKCQPLLLPIRVGASLFVIDASTWISVVATFGLPLTTYHSHSAALSTQEWTLPLEDREHFLFYKKLASITYYLHQLINKYFIVRQQHNVISYLFTNTNYL